MGALKKADAMRWQVRLIAERKPPTVRSIVEQYRVEKLPKLRHSTQRVIGCGSTSTHSVIGAIV
jgi:hypothetical protein